MRRERHAKAGADITIDSNLLGPCGYYCGYCMAHKKGICLGCRYQADKKRKEGFENFCTTLNCAERKGMKRCSDCPSYPCKKEYDPDGTGMYSWTYYKYIRDEIKPQ